MKLIAVSKTHPSEQIMEAYRAGQSDFGENKVQELISKAPLLPNDINWHLIGHLQSNKLKYIAPFIHTIHSVDSLKLLSLIQKEAQKNNRTIECLLQVHIAMEETKFGMSEAELTSLLTSGEHLTMDHIRIRGLMGMASFTDDMDQVRGEFRYLRSLFMKIKQTFFAEKEFFNQLSMGMSSDYHVAIEEGSTMVRIGSSIFGERNYSS